MHRLYDRKKKSEADEGGSATTTYRNHQGMRDSSFIVNISYDLFHIYIAHTVRHAFV